MNVLNKFDGSTIAEIEELAVENLNINISSGEYVNISKFNDTVIQCLEDLLKSNDSLAIMSQETGKTKGACRSEIQETIRRCKNNFFPDAMGAGASELLRPHSMKVFDHIIMESSLPIYTMIEGIFSSMRRLHRAILIHSPVAPTTSMTLSSNIYEKYRESGSFLLDVLDKEASKNIDLMFMNTNIRAWGIPDEVRQIQKNTERNRILWKPIGNVVSIVEDRQRLEMASNSLASMSYNTISNRGLRTQLFLVNDKNYIFFKNRVIEFLKRDIKNGYGPEGDINYFCNSTDADKSKKAVKDLISSGFNYNEGLYEGVHLLDNQYGKDFPQMPHIPGPVMAIMHYSSLDEALEIASKFPDRIFVNIFSDNVAKMDFVYETEGGNSKVLRNVENSRELIPYL